MKEEQGREDRDEDPARVSGAVAGVAGGMEAYLESKAEGASEEEAFAAALGRAVERYLDSLNGAERVRVLLGLHRPGVRILEERVLPEDLEGRKRTLKAAAELQASGKLRRVRSRGDGRIFWVRVEGTGS